MEKNQHLKNWVSGFFIKPVVEKLKIAVIDLGTNTFHLLIAEINKDSNYHILYRTKAVVKLLSGESREGFPISDEGISIGVNTIQKFNEIIQQYIPSKVVCFATSAVRSASNQKQFINAIKAKTGIDVTVISGTEEAEYIYRGVCHALNIGKSKSLIMDIGGGSVEFVIADRSKIHWSKSYSIGAARLKDKFHKNDPIGLFQIDQLTNFLNYTLDEVIQKGEKYKVATLIGSPGSFDTFADMVIHQFNLPGESQKRQNEFELKIEHFKYIHKKLMNSTLKERLKMKGMKSFRADMIVVASVLTCFILESLNINRIRVSGYALKEGILISAGDKFFVAHKQDAVQFNS